MSTLKLSYIDGSGKEETVMVSGSRFTIGRHSSCDLTIADGRLSREHIVIERTDAGYSAADMGSSNGTELNGAELIGREQLRNGDVLDLGGVRVNIQLESGLAAATPVMQEQNAVEPISGLAKGVAASEPNGLGFPMVYLLAAPILGLIVLAFAAGLFIVFSDNNGGNASAQNFEDPIDEDTPKRTNKKGQIDDEPPPASTNQATPATTPTGQNVRTPDNTAPAGSVAMVEQHASGFLRHIAENDPTAFLTADQAKRVDAKIKQLAGNSALAANIESARKNASQISSLAKAKGLAPGLVAVAAINKLGSSRGDALKTSQDMIEVLDKLETQIGSELSDEALLMIAAYEQGVAGDFLKMRNMLQNLSNEFSDSSRSIRTIWFLEQKGKISRPDYERALSFLAIGTIAQSPKDFGVNTEPLRF
ncbi:MAG: FHA domain-containing protein [Pyrinomonadaceae bacterium]|nr:FHA domain-containing protein [Pyrinomonadaceae bacterium]